MRSTLLLVLAATMLVAADGAKDDKAREALKKLEGAWVVESASAEGERIRGEVVIEYSFKGNKLVRHNLSDGVKETFLLKLDPSVSPQAIDLISKDKEYVFKGIYEIKGEALKICLSKAEPGKRPTEFTGGRGYALVMLMRPNT